MKPFMIATALAMLATSAYAKIDKACVDVYRQGAKKNGYNFDLAAAKRICDSKNKSKLTCGDEKSPYYVKCE